MTVEQISHLRARVYDSAIAQFLTVDPAEPIRQVPYGYAQDNPLRRRQQKMLQASVRNAVCT